MSDEYEYFWKSGVDMDEAQLEECSALFSEHYGLWGRHHERHGQRIRLGAKRLRGFLPEGSWALLARHRGALIGHAFGVRVDIPERGVVDWVTQLVVHAEHRNRGVAKDLLLTFFGFSNHFAWGLVTSNPFAVRALERITHRRCVPREIETNLDVVTTVGERIGYVHRSPTTVDAAQSIINTKFHIDLTNLPGKLQKASERTPWLLGQIQEGEEWLAFTFREQPMMALDRNELRRLLDRSDRTVKQAYARMKRGPMHAWMKATEPETNFAVQALALKPGARVLDLGCGNGRHTLRLARGGYNVTGVDFVQDSLDQGRLEAEREGLLGARFECADGRTVDLGAASFDAAICLYDVIGTFPEQEHNQLLLNNIARHLKPGGRALISVLNMELTRSIATRRGAVEDDPRLLQELPPSRVMQETGNIFEPELFHLDEAAGIVYRKEQFEGDGRPPGEYIVRDRRYTREDVAAMCGQAGLRLAWARPVALGKWEQELAADDPKAKEILFLVERG
ncbi:hypothetical protein BE20_13435 [Sorangium cellulosum]|uniref:Methyltransferase domain-containing protein n=1 Tax=Sorangium cellulosum TaxID=56 RepID=A0A150SHL9_SORCE|nr:hypothetical protein BE18_13770 [Sorangium cellulosum]KYF91860.1 hypothetical protein BE20_13435 [Sorangium cellulosum]